MCVTGKASCSVKDIIRAGKLRKFQWCLCFKNWMWNNKVMKEQVMTGFWGLRWSQIDYSMPVHDLHMWGCMKLTKCTRRILCCPAICILDCLNGGFCSAPNTCNCRGTGYTGSQCQTGKYYYRSFHSLYFVRMEYYAAACPKWLNPRDYTIPMYMHIGKLHKQPYGALSFQLCISLRLHCVCTRTIAPPNCKVLPINTCIFVMYFGVF